MDVVVNLLLLPLLLLLLRLLWLLNEGLSAAVSAADITTTVGHHKDQRQTIIHVGKAQAVSYT